jgi:hypothetical protein
VKHKITSSSGHEVRPINDLFRPHDCIHLVVSLTVVHKITENAIYCYVFNYKGCEDMDWIHLAHDKEQWHAPEDMVMNLKSSVKKSE